MSKIQTGLRMTEKTYEELSAISNETGVSLNALALMLIELGLSVTRLGAREALRALLHSSKHTDG